LGVQLHSQKTRIVHVQHGFEFLGYKIRRAPIRKSRVRTAGDNTSVGMLYGIHVRSQSKSSRIRYGS
jgi:hypothetical protein